MRFGKTWLVILMVLLATFVTVNDLHAASSKNKKIDTTIHPDTFSNLFEKSVKHTVLISVNGKGQGSGFVLTADGFILTNAHVVKDDKEVKVYVSEKKYYKARVVGKPDTELDVAVVKIDEPVNLAPVPLGDSDKVKPGEWVYAIGTPFGLYQSVTVGVVSGVHRGGPFGGTQEVIQTDAAINPGNSGGPLFSIKGEVVGMNSSIINPEKANNIGFAIPINDVLKSAREIIAKGKVTYAHLGVEITDLTQDLDEETAKAKNIPWPLPANEGVFIVGVQENTGAALAGVSNGDIIVSFNGVSITGAFHLQRLVARSPVGVSLPMEVLRNGQKLKLNVVLTERPMRGLEEENGGGESPQLPEKKKNSFPNFGESLELLPPAVAEVISGNQGLLTEDSIDWRGNSVYRYTNAFLVDEKYIVSVTSFLNKDPLQAYRSHYFFNRIPAKLVFAESEIGLALFKLEKPYPNYKKPVVFSEKTKVGTIYFSLVLKNIGNGDSLPYSEILLNRVGPALIFPAKVKNIALGAPIFNVRGEVVGLFMNTGIDPNEPKDVSDATYAISAPVIQAFVEAVKENKENDLNPKEN
ncbi:MAG: hypothetical protein A3G49_01355 [Candidatus Sungbacteria bacterium RIFCSPLOWO2_12_FULL_41_11]|uniref:PDZ domain-containing protein n=1 Tax=Candidatus Sungbacteria bacterium RIFCSPLOWO2_12_FULL_41_11 TaxID=1802286 RepID=A0A1G2LNS8_9BACT|nr:MAG: Protease Do [Parcubacteria group bacterium GW2011_GWA2_42_14]OGZ97402.1 MAG: hypothetical protein A3D41_05535 [Candidatus Sungbacteria bacterium RIFCSPHIGHO2_02_FULL_41_12b]OHA13280.1 MAG: hypothetical protein A3G49_01355 [Candidatus Sungbacteria bacterium RIFCSPLOWO2_12_FULL_41_11]